MADIAAIYDYTDAQGNLIFQVVRFDPKAFRTRRPDGSGGWMWSYQGFQPYLYRLPEVVRANTVLIVEGEKDVETAYRLHLPVGWAATSNPFGSCQWRANYSETLRGKRVILCPDTDGAGQRHLLQVGLALIHYAAEIRVLHLPAGVKDLSEWVERGGQVAQFALLLQQAQSFDYPRPDTVFKQKIEPIGAALDTLLHLRGVFYEWKDPETQGNLMGQQMGLIAQEVEAVIPQWVDVDADGYKSLSIRGFEALTIEAFRELKAENEALRQRCYTLEAQIHQLQADKKV